MLPAVGRSPPANTMAVDAREGGGAPAPMFPSAGIIRFRFEGSATRDGRPLSPADPSSPVLELSVLAGYSSPPVDAAEQRGGVESGAHGHGSGRHRGAHPPRRDRVEQLRSPHLLHRCTAHGAWARTGARACASP